MNALKTQKQALQESVNLVSAKLDMYVAVGQHYDSQGRIQAPNTTTQQKVSHHSHTIRDYMQNEFSEYSYADETEEDTTSDRGTVKSGDDISHLSFDVHKSNIPNRTHDSTTHKHTKRDYFKKMELKGTIEEEMIVPERIYYGYSDLDNYQNNINYAESSASDKDVCIHSASHSNSNNEDEDYDDYAEGEGIDVDQVMTLTAYKCVHCIKQQTPTTHQDNYAGNYNKQDLDNLIKVLNMQPLIPVSLPKHTEESDAQPFKPGSLPEHTVESDAQPFKPRSLPGYTVESDSQPIKHRNFPEHTVESDAQPIKPVRLPKHTESDAQPFIPVTLPGHTIESDAQPFIPVSLPGHTESDAQPFIPVRLPGHTESDAQTFIPVSLPGHTESDV